MSMGATTRWVRRRRLAAEERVALLQGLLPVLRVPPAADERVCAQCGCVATAHAVAAAAAVLRGPCPFRCMAAARKPANVDLV